MPPWLHELLGLANSAGGMAGLAAIVTALGTLRRQEKGMAAVRAELEPNHGSSMKDAMGRIEKQLYTLSDRVESLDHRLGHEIGDMRRSADTAHADLAARIRHLEQNH